MKVEQDFKITMAGSKLDRYYFQVYVREGEPGLADDSDYISSPYYTFEGAYISMANFSPSSHWRHLRRVEAIYIWREGYPKVEMDTLIDEYKIDSNHLANLSITREEFEQIIIHS